MILPFASRHQRLSFAEIDGDDLLALLGYAWALDKGGYCVTRVGRKTIGMHRVIMERVAGPLPPGAVVDHKDGNRLNNTRANLRLATKSQNGGNMGPWRSKRSRYKGVTRDRLNMKWRAAIKANGKAEHLGTYESEEDAARAYDAAALRLYGEFARPNFPAPL